MDAAGTLTNAVVLAHGSSRFCEEDAQEAARRIFEDVRERQELAGPSEYPSSTSFSVIIDRNVDTDPEDIDGVVIDTEDETSPRSYRMSHDDQ